VRVHPNISPVLGDLWMHSVLSVGQVWSFFVSFLGSRTPRGCTQTTNQAAVAVSFKRLTINASCLEDHTDRARSACLEVARDPSHFTFFLQPPVITGYSQIC